MRDAIGQPIPGTICAISGHDLTTEAEKCTTVQVWGGPAKEDLVTLRGICASCQAGYARATDAIKAGKPDEAGDILGGLWNSWKPSPEQGDTAR